MKRSWLPVPSVEGYRVSTELIERVRGGRWNPEKNEEDRQQRNAMAARGYWQAYQAVQKSVGRVLHGDNPGVVADEDHGIVVPGNVCPQRDAQIC